MRQQLQISAIVILVTSISLQGCQRGQESAPLTEGDAQVVAVRMEADAWSRAISAKDLEKTLSFYAADAQYLPAGRAAVSTPDARRKVWIEDYGLPGFSSAESTTRIEVARSADLAYQLGTYVVTTRDEQGNPTNSTGKFAVVWKKQTDGKWKAIVDIDNADR